MATGIAIKRGVRPSLTRIIEDDMVLRYSIPAGTTESLGFIVNNLNNKPVNIEAKISYDNGANFYDCSIPIAVDSNICPNPIIKIHILYDMHVLISKFTGSLSEVDISYNKVHSCSFSSSKISRCKINVANMQNLNYMFNYCQNLVKVEIVGLGSVNPSYGTNLRGMFNACKNLLDVSISDTRYVTDMSDMFAYCNNIVNIPYMDTRSVVNMGSMFISCFALTGVPPMDTGNVTNMGCMFMHCRSLTSKPNLFIRDDCNVDRMYYGTTLS